MELMCRQACVSSLAFWGHRHPLPWAPTIPVSIHMLPNPAKTYINHGILRLSLPLPRSSGLTLDPLNQVWNILFPLVQVLPNKFIRIRRRARIAAPPTNKNFPIIHRRSWNSSRRIPLQKRPMRDDRHFPINRRQRIQIP